MSAHAQSFALCSFLLAGCDLEPKSKGELQGVAEAEARRAAAAANPIVPDDDQAAIDRFDSMLNQDANVQLIEELPPYLEKYPNSYQGYLLLGWAYSRSDRLDEAMAAFERSIELNPKFENAYVGQGVVWRERGDLDKAVASYHKALELNPNAAEAYSSLTVIELKRGNYDKALEVGMKGWELSDKQDPIIAANLAIACHYAKDEKQRDEMLELARSLGYPKMARLEDIISGKLDPF
jgi:tetratricopeptide (TPR) repeat protein